MPHKMPLDEKFPVEPRHRGEAGRNLMRLIHPVAGMVAMLMLATFWLSTVLSELFGSEATVLAVKSTIPWGFALLAPALAATGSAGFGLSKGQRQGLIGAKLKRMPFIAANGMFVLIPTTALLKDVVGVLSGDIRVEKFPGY